MRHLPSQKPGVRVFGQKEGYVRISDRWIQSFTRTVCALLRRGSRYLERAGMARFFLLKCARGDIRLSNAPGARPVRGKGVAHLQVKNNRPSFSLKSRTQAQPKA